MFHLLHSKRTGRHPPPPRRGTSHRSALPRRRTTHQPPQPCRQTVHHPTQQLGPYKLGKRLGQSRLATVRHGKHMRLGTEVAIKTWYPPLTDDQISQIEYEAYTTAHLVHPNIVRVLDFVMQHNTYFLVMEYAPKGSLRTQHPAGTRLHYTTVLSYVRQIAAALQYTHNHGIIHCDVKPENLLLTYNDKVLLCDFGIAAEISSRGYPHIENVAGTALYMAPEHIGGYPHKASDQYALAIVAFELLTGSPPFVGDTSLDILYQHLHSPVPPLRARRSLIPLAVEGVLRRALSKKHWDRFPSVWDFYIALRDAYTSTVVNDTNSRRRHIFVTAAAMLGLPLLLILFGMCAICFGLR